MKRFHTVLLAAGAVLLALAGCNKKPAPYGDFDNKVYIDQNTNVTTMLVKQSSTDAEHSFHAATPKPVEGEVKLLFEADESLVADYNRLFGDEAAMLPASYYSIENAETSIAAGSTRSADVTVRFRELGTLDTESLHVLPVTMRSAEGIAMLESARTIYYVLRGAAIINVVADLEESNYITFEKVLDGQSASCAVLNDMQAVTMEALVRCSDYVLEPGIKTVMGIEGHCLIRISDNGLAPNQWVHIAVTCDVAAGRAVVYLNGEVALDQSGNSFSPISLGKPKSDSQGKNHYFNIGYSYTSGRELHGEVCEVRIWNVVRTQEEIVSNVYEVDPTSEGLVAYWKCDEGAGDTIRDHTGNGNNGTANSALKWNSVSLPESSTEAN